MGVLWTRASDLYYLVAAGSVQSRNGDEHEAHRQIVVHRHVYRPFVQFFCA